MTPKKNKDKKFLDIQLTKDYLIYIGQLASLVLIYGLIISLITNVILHIPFTIGGIFAWGFLAYIIKMEVPTIIASSFPVDRK